MSSTLLESIAALSLNNPAFFLPNGLRQDDLYWYCRPRYVNYVITKDAWRAYEADAAYGLRPDNPQPARLAIVGKWSSREFKLDADATWSWEHEEEGQLFGEGGGILQDNDSVDRQSHFKRGWDALNALQTMRLPEDVGVRAVGLLETMWGEKNIRLSHDFIEVRIFKSEH